MKCSYTDYILFVVSVNETQEFLLMKKSLGQRPLVKEKEKKSFIFGKKNRPANS